MRTNIHAVLLGGVIAISPLAWLAGCSSGEITLADAGVPDLGQEDASTSSDLAGRDLAGSDLASSDLASGGGGDTETDPKVQGITSLHNQVRAGVMPVPATAIPPLIWDSTVAAAAQVVADTCMFQHSANGYGENIYANAGSTPTPADVVNDWASEKANYTYSNNTCASGKTCGHYTQVVWRGSQKLGCAQKTCTKNSPFSGFPTWNFWVCDYSPPGNSGGRKPY